MYGVSLANVLDIIETSFELVVKGLLIATLGSLARGILYARTSTPAKLATPGRISSIAFVVLVSILSIAFLGLGISYYVGSRSITSLHANNIWGALHIIFFILALGLLGLGGLVFTKVKTLAHLQLVSFSNPPSCLHMPFPPPTSLSQSQEESTPNFFITPLGRPVPPRRLWLLLRPVPLHAHLDRPLRRP